MKLAKSIHAAVEKYYWWVVALTGALLCIAAAVFETPDEMLATLAYTFLAATLVGLLSNIGLANRTATAVSEGYARAQASSEQWFRDGIQASYPTRADAMHEIAMKLNDSEPGAEVCALGVCLDRDFRAQETLEQLLKRGHNPDKIRFLLLDGMASPSVFLELLGESCKGTKLTAWERALSQKNGSAEELRVVLENRPNWGDLGGFRRRMSRVEKGVPCVRFYAHLPSMWIVRVDDDIFYQQLSLNNVGGRGHSRAFDERPLDGGTVFKTAATSRIGKLIVEHFEVLWETSNIDSLAVLRRLASDTSAERGELQYIYDTRGSWLRYVLQYKRGPFRRRDPRHTCPKERQVDLKIYAGDTLITYRGVLVNYSLRGAAIDVAIDNEDATATRQLLEGCLKSEVDVEFADDFAGKEERFWTLLPLGRRGKPSPMRIVKVDVLAAGRNVRVGLQAPSTWGAATGNPLD